MAWDVEKRQKSAGEIGLGKTGDYHINYQLSAYANLDLSLCLDHGHEFIDLNKDGFLRDYYLFQRDGFSARGDSVGVG